MSKEIEAMLQKSERNQLLGEILFAVGGIVGSLLAYLFLRKK